MYTESNILYTMFEKCPENLIFEFPGSIPTQVNTKTLIVAKIPYVYNNTIIWSFY